MFEQLAKAYAREPESLDAVASLMRKLDAYDQSDVVPPEFRAMWSIFEAALQRERNKG
jgi:hypothetical protein